MAVLQEIGAGTLVCLGLRNLVGRGKECNFVLDDPRVSGEHASIVRRGDQWLVRDIGSRNGTFVDDKAVETGQTAVLSTGCTVRFADSAWRVLHTGPVQAAAQRVDTDAVVLPSAGMLALPSDDDPQALIYEESDGAWVLESTDASGPLQHATEIQLGAERWRVCGPPRDRAQALPSTWDLASGPTLTELGLHLAVSQDEEHIDLALVKANRRSWVSPRAHHGLVLLLARARIDDQSQADIPEAEQGWLYIEDVCRNLRIEPPQLNLWLFRARKQLAELGIQGAATVFQRRRMSQQLRLGLRQVSVGRL